MPPLAIIMLTFQRTGYALRTIAKAIENLKYDGDIFWYVADDGSHENHVKQVLEALNGQNLYSSHTLHRGYGGNANTAWREVNKLTPISLWLEDDWELERPYDVSHHVKVLEGYIETGVIHLSHLPIEQVCHTEDYYDRRYLCIWNKKPYMFRGNPHLKHSRLVEDVGFYKEGISPGQTEVEYDNRYRQYGYKKVLFPLELGDKHLFGHIGTYRSYDPHTEDV